MEIHQLEYVLALERYKHFSLAAEEINVSQPTLSHQIKKLEDELGVELFVRTTRSVKLTPAGEDFMIYAKRILSDVQNAKLAMQEHTHLQKGSIKIGATANITYLGITSLIAEFQKMYPGISIKLYEDITDNLIKRMHTHEIDVAFIHSINDEQQIADIYPLIHDRIVLFVSRSHALADRESVDLSELATEKFVMYKMSGGIRKELIQYCRDAGFEPDIIFESSHVETMKGLVEEGVGVLLSSNIVASCILDAKTAIVNLTPSIKRITSLAVSKNSNLLTTQAFRDFILKHYDQ